MGPIDTHAHLADLPNVESVFTRAKAAGLSGIVAVSASIPTIESTLKLAIEHRGFIHAALGIHPAEFFNQNLEAALEIIKKNEARCVAIGEIGLDYWHKQVRKDKAQSDRQMEFYARQLELSRDLDLPVSIHSRGAWRDCVKLAIKYGSGRGVFHWYSGPLDVLTEALDAGYYVSCSPAVEISRELRSAMVEAPIERILIETDSPVWIKSLNRPSEPSDLLMTLRHLSELKGTPQAEVESVTTRNAEILFSL